ncbi:hypothetical protein [Snodgrassella sp. B3837]|uniref:hypothetical protein n=1 Tax=Snodgrassella sp. B3837 TaxID=2818040 RepID=UPI00226AC9D6|nr:hypothetical protein [Snodgrassella sp. B3837]MCX8753430.1 hypothetical protein [Snodgrassella sp. B3837]
MAPAARAEALPLVRVLGDPVLILPSSAKGNKLLTSSDKSDMTSLSPEAATAIPTSVDTIKPPGIRPIAP